MYSSIPSDFLWLVARVAMSYGEFQRIMKLAGVGMDRYVKPVFQVVTDAPVPRLAQLTIPPFELAFAGSGLSKRGVGLPSSLG